MSVEEEFSRFSERYKSYSKYDNLYGILLFLTALCFLYLFVLFLNVSFAFTFVSMIVITYIVYILRQSYTLTDLEKLFFHSYSCYTHLDKYVKERDNNDRKKAIENLEEMIGILKESFFVRLSFPHLPNIHRDLEERLLPIIRDNDEKNINQALSILKEFIPFAQGGMKILYSAEKSQSFKNEIFRLPVHPKQWTIPLLWSKTKSIDGLMLISVFLIPVSIFLAGVYIFKYTEKEMYIPAVTAFVALLGSFVIRRRK